MSVTRNGWGTNVVWLTPIKAPHSDDTGNVRFGAIAELFQHFVNEFDKRVEPVTVVNGNRSAKFNAAVGGDPSSNHVSATALDLNGSKHPYEANLPTGSKYYQYRSGFTSEQTAEINKILSELGGCIRWGLTFNWGYRDAMHFELATTSVDRIQETLDRINQSINTPPVPEPSVKKRKKRNMDTLVEKLYEAFIGRKPSVYEVIDWTVSAAKNDWDAAALKEAFISSPAEAGTIRIAYAKFLGSSRKPTSANIKEWTTGRTILDAWSGIGHSAEAEAYAEANK